VLLKLMLHLLDVVGQLAEQERVKPLHLTYHSPYDVACNSERHFCQMVVNVATGRVGMGDALFGGRSAVPHTTCCE